MSRKWLIYITILTGLHCTSTKTLKYITCTPGTDGPTIQPIKDTTLSLERGKKYVFVLEGLNNAYYGVDYDIEKSIKNISLPAVLAPYVPSSVTATTHGEREIAMAAFSGPIDFLQKTQLLYDTLSRYAQLITPGIKKLEEQKDDDSGCRTTANELIKTASGILRTSGSNTVADSVGKKVNQMIDEFKNRVQLIKDNDDLNADPVGLRLLTEKQFVVIAEKEMRSYPNILAAYQHCIKSIPSKPYNVDKADYLDVSFTIYGHKYADEKDSLLSQTLRFYRIHYFSLDVSAGFFRTNLLSQSYYFTDSMASVAKEPKTVGNISVGALVEFNYAVKSYFKAGPCIGAAVSLMDAKPQLFMGINLVLGRSLEFAVSGGLAYAYLPVPSNALTVPGYASSPETSVPVYNKFKQGWFIGISYNFIK
jgi:hypothetical protein